MSLPFIPTAYQTSENMALLFISPMLTFMRVFYVVSLWGTVFSHVCRCRDVNRVLLHVRTCVCVSWLCPLEFPENSESTHLIATQHIMTHQSYVQYSQLSPVSPLPFHASLFSLFCCSICASSCSRLPFIETTLLTGTCLQGPQVGNYTKLKIIA